MSSSDDAVDSDLRTVRLNAPAVQKKCLGGGSDHEDAIDPVPEAGASEDSVASEP